MSDTNGGQRELDRLIYFSDAVFVVSIGISFLSVPLAISSWVLMFLADALVWRLQRRRLRPSA